MSGSIENITKFTQEKIGRKKYIELSKAKAILHLGAVRIYVKDSAYS